jgi:hypothetical protein
MQKNLRLIDRNPTEIGENLRCSVMALSTEMSKSVPKCPGTEMSRIPFTPVGFLVLSVKLYV